MFIDFFSKTINAQLATLIISAPLDEEEKKGWLEMLPLMTDGEKEVLKNNLIEEVDDFYALESEKLKEFDDRLNQALVSDR